MKLDEMLDKLEPTLRGLSAEMTHDQTVHMLRNVDDFGCKYSTKYVAGQKAHGGNMWEMGAYQALENAEEEALDNWSYLRQIRKCLDEIANTIFNYDHDVIVEALDYGRELGEETPKADARKAIEDIKKILNRQKDDGEKR